ncbi:MAG: O-antigen ligase family protein, partial [Acidimicrobiales bacterium]
MPTLDNRHNRHSRAASGFSAGPDAAVDGRSGRSDAMGDLGLLACRSFLLIVPSIMLGAFLGTSLPANALFVLPAVGAMLVAPRARLQRLPVSIALVLLLAWMGLSYLWSVDQPATLFALREDLAPILGLIIVVGLLPVDESVKWLVRGFKLMVAMTAVVIILLPETRETFLEQERLDAWRGWFPGKNHMGRSVLVAYLVFLTLDRTRVSRLIGIVAALVLTIGSSSATALAGVFLVTGVWIWGRQFRRVGEHAGVAYLLTSIAGGITAGIAAFASAAWLVNLLGRDLSFSGRTDVWGPSLDFVSNRPWVGYGYRALFTPNTSESLELWREMGFRAAHSHSGPIEVALGLGAIGLLLFFLVYISTFASSLRYLKTHDVALFAFAFALPFLS